jgi:hypothetical protein
MKCNLSYSNPCPNEAEFSVHWHMSFDPAAPCHNYVCSKCLAEGRRALMIVIDSVTPLGRELGPGDPDYIDENG